MSGFEVAGLVLGAIPILFAAVDFSKKNIGRGAIFFRKRRHVEKLALALLSQREHLSEIIQSILVESGCKDLARLEEDPVVYLQDDEIQEQVLDYLGEETFTAFSGLILHCHETIKGIAMKTAYLVPGVQGPCDDLLRIIEENRAAKAKQLDLMLRVKLMLGADELRETIKDLDNTTNSLFRLTRLVLSNRQATGGQTSRSALRMAKSLRRAHESASNLYTAISHAWKGDCHQGHETNLFLEDRIQDKTAGRRPASTPLAFPLVFATMPSEKKKVWYEAVVRVLHDDEDSPVLEQQSTSQIPAGQQRVAFIVTSAEPPRHRPQVLPVDNICTVDLTRPVAFVLTRQPKIGLMVAAGPNFVTSAPLAKTSLKDVLSSQRKTPVSLQLRMLLALRLASNLLQLLQTHWLPLAWSDEQVFFPIHTKYLPADGQLLAPPSNVDFARPFISASFAQPTSPQLQCPPKADPKTALLGLGILLLEIWHQETLETHFSLRAEKQQPTKFYELLTLALEWLDDMSNPPPELYYQAASHCIKGMLGGEARLGQWEDGELWNAVCGDVVEPLLKNCSIWRRR
ncbi:hypothetical protein QBC44DRAFT_375996 [Cladorrhinum sp. PSN332]|nr:hypothetical protein QBC44DRAFT_375996 [Cladorrhinum sp. PSN332]